MATRVNDGGHDVPTEAVERRYSDRMAKLSLALTIADRSYVFDNSGERRHLFLTREDGRIKYCATEMPGWAVTAIPAGLRMLDH